MRQTQVDRLTTPQAVLALGLTGAGRVEAVVTARPQPIDLIRKQELAPHVTAKQRT
jgi:hypothetical protein